MTGYIDLRFKSATWTGPSTPARRSKYTFRADWNDTIDLLARELEYLGASDIVIEAGLRREDIRVDGWPRANAPQPAHPGVVIYFQSKHGPLRYSTDAFGTWQANVRAIGLGLEALRKVERYGITHRGEQYTGWKALPAGSGAVDGSARAVEPQMSREDAITVVLNLAGWSTQDPLSRAGLIREGDLRDTIFARARRKAHPDSGGSEEAFKRYQQAERVLLGQRTLTAP